MIFKSIHRTSSPTNLLWSVWNLVKTWNIAFLPHSLMWVMVITSCNLFDHSKRNPSVLVKELKNYSESFIDKGAFSGVMDVTVGMDSLFWLVYKAQSSSGDPTVMVASGKGASWKDVLTIQPAKKKSVKISHPQIWMDPDGKLWIFWTKQVNYSSGIDNEIWALTGDHATDDLIRSKPFFISDGILMGKPVLLSNGKFILPIGKGNLVFTIASFDHGTTWNHEGMVELAEDLCVHEAVCTVIECRNGSLWMLIQTSKGIWESQSTEQGLSWSSLAPSDITSAGNPFFVQKLNSDNILLVRQAENKSSELAAYVSYDNRQTWVGGFTLDENVRVSHITGIQAKDQLFPCCAVVSIFYSIQQDNRNEMRIKSFTEDDVIVGQKRHHSSPFH